MRWSKATTRRRLGALSLPLPSKDGLYLSLDAAEPLIESKPAMTTASEPPRLLAIHLVVRHHGRNPYWLSVGKAFSERGWISERAPGCTPNLDRDNRTDAVHVP